VTSTGGRAREAGGAGPILLARHGETDANAEHRFQGRADVPLNARGRAQAAELAERVAAEVPGLAAIVASPLRRARETAEVVGRRVGLRPSFDARLEELDVGTWTGRLYADVRAAEPEAFAAWLGAGWDFRPPGGESLLEQRDRVVAALGEVRAGPRPALVVCHGGVMRAALAHARGTEPEGWQAGQIPNAALVPLPAPAAA
jgi:probable phosphoglycerate mutase